MVRGVILPYVRGGVDRGGPARARPRARRGDRRHAGDRHTAHLTANLFDPGDTLASRIAAQYQAAASNLQVASLIYLG